MRSYQNSRIACDTVDIDMFRIDNRDGIVAVAIDSATDLMSGIGIDQNPAIAVEKCILDALHPNGWTPACGVPHPSRYHRLSGNDEDSGEGRRSVSTTHKIHSDRPRRNPRSLTQYETQLRSPPAGDARRKARISAFITPA